MHREKEKDEASTNGEEKEKKTDKKTCTHEGENTAEKNRGKKSRDE